MSRFPIGTGVPVFIDRGAGVRYKIATQVSGPIVPPAAFSLERFPIGLTMKSDELSPESALIRHVSHFLSENRYPLFREMLQMAPEDG
jgi:hypothetical protein